MRTEPPLCYPTKGLNWKGAVKGKLEGKVVLMMDFVWDESLETIYQLRGRRQGG